MSDASNEKPEVETPPKEVIYDQYRKPEILKVRSQTDPSTVLVYTIHEVSGNKQYWEWYAQLQAMYREIQEKKTPKDNIYDLIVLILLQCCKHDGKPVAKEVFEDWGISLKDAAFELVQKMNSSTPKAAEDKGKSSGNADTITTGSALPEGSVAQ